MKRQRSERRGTWVSQAWSWEGGGPVGSTGRWVADLRGQAWEGVPPPTRTASQLCSIEIYSIK